MDVSVGRVGGALAHGKGPQGSAPNRSRESAGLGPRPRRGYPRSMPPSPMSSSAGRFRLRDLLPLGPGRHPRPRPFLEMAEVAWANRDNLPYAWRILTRGVCDGCSLGPRGLRDDVIDGVHLCMTRLKLLRLNTMGPIPEDRLRDLRPRPAPSNPELQPPRRLPLPLLHP